MALAKFSTEQAVFTNLLFVLCLVVGGLVYRLLPVDTYPDISLDEAHIQTIYLGASPEDVEQSVTKKIEEEINDVPGVSRIASYSVANISNIFVKFREDLEPQDFEASFQEVRARLDRVTDLPQEVEKPLLTRLTLGEVWPVLQVVIANEGGGSEPQIRAVARDLKDALRQLPGILKIKEVGLRDPEIHILIDKDELEAYDLSLPEVAEILRRSNLNIPAGNIQTASEELTVRAVGNVVDPEELGDTCIKKSPIGAHIYLRDIAEIREDFERRVVMARYMAKSCAFLYVAKTREADSITIRNAVDKALVDYRHKLPPGVSVSLFADTSQMISSRLGILKNNLLVGLVLVFVILWMFIGARNSLLAIIGIPFSFLCAFIFMYLINVSLNAVSVFALVLVSGMIVDDAIVVLENIYRHLQLGKSAKQAAIDGTDEVMWPVVSSALTTMAAFLPLLVMSGVVGRFFAIIPKTVTVALLASLFECLIILPSHFLHWGPRQKRTADGAGMRENIETPVHRLYERVLGYSLRYRYLGLGLVLALAFCAYEAQRTLRVELFPSDFPTMVATFNVDSEASLGQTDAVCMRVLPVLDEYIKAGYVKTHSTAIGMQINEDNQMRQRSNIAQVWIELEQVSALRYDPEEVMDDIRMDFSDFVARNPELHIQNLKLWPLLDGPPVGKPVAIRIEHPDYDTADRIAGDITRRLKQIDGVFDVADNFDIGQRELRLTLREEAASEFGLTFKGVFSVVSAANEGVVIGSFNDTNYDEDLDVRVRYQQDFRSSEDQLLDVDIKSPLGQLIKLRQVADIEYAQGYATHYRHDGKRAIQITANVDKDRIDADRVVRTIFKEFGELQAADENLAIVAAGEFKETHDSFASLINAGAIAIFIMYLILAAQFKSYIQPLIILFSLMFGAIGMIMGLVANGYPFSVITGIALVGLFGVVVNDAIVMMSFINTERQRDVPVQEAVTRASLVRGRPILLTTLTTVGGLLPMALGIGGYNKVWSPFATCLCWGLATATLMIMLFLPPFYMIVEDIRSKWIRWLRSPDLDLAPSGEAGAS